MKLLNNRKFAWAVLAVCMLVSVIGFGGGSLAAQRSQAMRVFNEGVDPSFAVRFSMDAYLENGSGYARVMAEEYRLYVDADGETAARVLELAVQIGDGEDLNARCAAYQALCASVETLYTDFHTASVADSDRKLFDNAYANFQGEVSKLKYDDYHALAEKFNQSRNGFPASAICSLLGIEPLNPF